MFDRSKHDQRLQRAKSIAPADADFLLRYVTEDMLERLSAINRTFDNAIALFGRTSHLSDAMTASPQINSVLRVEESTHLGNADMIATPTMLNLEAQSADLIVAPLSLHWSDDLPGTLIQLHQTLRADGLLMAALPGPDTVHELNTAMITAESEISGGAARRVDPFTDIRDAGTLLQRAGFALPVVDQDLITVRYDRPVELINDLRRFGATFHLENSTNPALNKTIFHRMNEIYREKFSDPDGRIRASFNIISLSGWAPHESQQKPLKPGSAKSRLADALKAK